MDAAEVDGSSNGNNVDMEFESGPTSQDKPSFQRPGSSVEAKREISAACGERSNAADAAEFNGAPKLQGGARWSRDGGTWALLLRCRLVKYWEFDSRSGRLRTWPPCCASQTLDQAPPRLLEWLVITEDQGRSLGRWSSGNVVKGAGQTKGWEKGRAKKELNGDEQGEKKLEVPLSALGRVSEGPCLSG